MYLFRVIVNRLEILLEVFGVRKIVEYVLERPRRMVNGRSVLVLYLPEVHRWEARLIPEVDVGDHDTQYAMLLSFWREAKVTSSQQE